MKKQLLSILGIFLLCVCGAWAADPTIGQLMCPTGAPLANCPVRVEYRDNNGVVATASTTTDAAGKFSVTLECTNSSGVGEHFYITSRCCGHPWIIASPRCSGDLGVLICQECNQEPCLPPPAGMVDWWPFDDPVGGPIAPIANDIAGAVNNKGVHVNGPTPVAGKVRNALCFDGSDDWVEVRDHAEVNFFGSCLTGAVAEDFSIDVWVRLEATAPDNGMTILDKRVNPENPIGYHLFIVNGRLGFQMADGTVVGTYVEPAASVTPGVWHLVAVTVDRCLDGAGIGTLYVDGNPVLNFNPVRGNIANTSNLFIGRRVPAFGPNFLRGCLDELEFFKRALTAAEVKALYDADSAGKCRPCVVLRCPEDIRVFTCEETIKVDYQPEVLNLCNEEITVKCTPPSGSSFPIGTHTVVCEVNDAAGTAIERCTFNVTVVGDTTPPVITCPSNQVVWACTNGVVVNYTVTATDDQDPNPTVICNPPSGSTFPPGAHTVTCQAMDECQNTSRCEFTVTVRVDDEPPQIICPNPIRIESCEPTVVNYTVLATDNTDPNPTVVCNPPSGSVFPVGVTQVHCRAIDRCGNESRCSFDVEIVCDDCLPPPAGMVDWWTFDEPIGPAVMIAHDIAGAVNNRGFHVNAPTPIAAGKVRGALCFDGQNDWVQVRNHAEVNFFGSCIAGTVSPLPAEDFSIDTWVLIDDNAVEGRLPIVDKRDNAQNPIGYHLFISNGQLAFQMADGAGISTYIEPTASITPGKWHLVAVTVERCENGVGVLYVDGAPVLTFNPRRGSIANDMDLFIGRTTPPFGDVFLRGCLDELELFKRALKPEEVKALYDADSRGKCRPCVAIRCPEDIRVVTCEEREIVEYTVEVINTCNSNIVVKCEPPSGSAFPVGSHTVVCQVTDPAGNEIDRCAFNVTVVRDTTPPVITCPSNQVYWSCSSNGVVVNYEVTATDDLDPSPTIVCQPPSGSVFPPGVHTVHCQAIDDCQNISRCEFTVTVRVDSEPPRIVCPEDIRKITCESNGMIVDYTVTATDDTGVVSLVCNPPSGSLFPVGTTTVICRAFDRCQKESRCEFKITIIADTEPPRIICPNPIRIESCEPTVVNYTVVATDDTDPNPTVVCNPPSGSVFPVGVTYVDCQAVDDCGRESRCSFDVEIVCNDCLPPPAGMVDWWTFDEPVSPVLIGIANDIAGAVNNRGIHVNAPTPIAAGKVRGALCFDGQNDWVQVRNHAEVNFFGSCLPGTIAAEDFSIDAWVRIDDNALEGRMPIVDKRDNLNEPVGYHLFISNGRLAFQMADGMGVDTYIEPAASITPGKWHLVAVTVDRCENGVGVLYVDGAPVLTFNPRRGNIANDIDLFIGRTTPPFGDVFLRGWLDELEFFKRALKPEEVKALYDADSRGKCRPCVAIRCPEDIRVVTCEERAIVDYTVEVINTCNSNIVVKCEPPSGSAFPVGTHTVVCQVTDPAGNEIDRCAFSVTVVRDTTPPVITCPSNQVAWACTSNSVVVNYTVTATDDLDPNPTIVCNPPSGSAFPPGVHTVQCQAIDDCQNTSRCEFTVTVRVDSEPPRIVCPDDIRRFTCESNGVVVNYTVTATDDSGVVSVVCNPPSGSLFPVGTTTVICRAFDRCQKESRCEFTVSVMRDIEPPRITCPSNITVVTTCTNVAQVNYTVTATDNADPNPTIVCNPPSGSVFPAGVTTVTCIATDDCGNKSECSFRVRVRPVQPPRLSIHRLPRGRIAVCWPLTAPGFQLQVAEHLNPPGPPFGWVDVADAPVIMDGEYCVIFEANERHRFYRLRCAGVVRVDEDAATLSED